MAKIVSFGLLLAGAALVWAVPLAGVIVSVAGAGGLAVVFENELLEDDLGEAHVDPVASEPLRDAA